MKKYIIILVILGCRKQPKHDLGAEILIYTAPTCAENILFCDDSEFDDLPENSSESDTGE